MSKLSAQNVKRRTRPRWLSLLAGILAYASYAIGSAGVIAIFSIVRFAPRMSVATRTRVLESVFRGFLRSFTQRWLPLLGVYTIDEISGDTRENDGPVIYVANHTGRLDGPILLGILKNTSAIMKERYAAILPYSFFIRTMNFIKINPHSLQALDQCIVACRAAISDGRNLLIFPEGARSTSRTLLPFRDLAFHIAVTLDLPIVPVVIRTDIPFMTRVKGSHFPRQRFGYRIRFLPGEKPRPGESASAVSDRIRKRMIEQYRALNATSDQEETAS
jgi:1-acyl-sn-glycerol-3-phosphate acyltransferase